MRDDPAMIILRDVSISLTPEEVLRAQRSNRRGGVQPALMAAAREAVALGRMLVAPAAVYDEFEVRDVVGEEVIGPALERRVSELHAAADDLLAFMLDSVGVLALGAIGEALRDRAEKRAAEFGWGVSPALSPGSLVGWPVEGQRGRWKVSERCVRCCRWIKSACD